MSVSATLQSPPKTSKNCFDTLFVSHDYDLFGQFTSYLKEHAPDRKPLLTKDLTTFAPFEDTLHQCDVMICDIRSNYSALEIGAKALEHAPTGILTIGLSNNRSLTREMLSLPHCLGLAGVIDTKDGWSSNWNEISAIKYAWQHPLMVSRIEEVPVGDVLQMIAAGRWSTIVVIDGYYASTTTAAPTSDQHIRGCISFHQGEPQTAWSSRGIGTQAIFDLLSTKRGVLQLIKNLGSPSLRNVDRETEELLISHAVALDESKNFHEKHNSVNNPPCALEATAETVLTEPDMLPAAVEATTPQTAPEHPQNPSEPGAGFSDSQPTKAWWKRHGNRFLEIIAAATPQSFPLRWMQQDELKRMAHEHTGTEFFVIYGNGQALTTFFTACARNFSTEKMHLENNYPVFRIGRSQESCLYFVGIGINESCSFVNECHCAILFSGENDQAFVEQLQQRHHASIHMINSPVPCPEIPEATSSVFHLSSPESSWQNLKHMISLMITTLQDID